MELLGSTLVPWVIFADGPPLGEALKGLGTSWHPRRLSRDTETTWSHRLSSRLRALTSAAGPSPGDAVLRCPQNLLRDAGMGSVFSAHMRVCPLVLGRVLRDSPAPQGVTAGTRVRPRQLSSRRAGRRTPLARVQPCSGCVSGRGLQVLLAVRRVRENVNRPSHHGHSPSSAGFVQLEVGPRLDVAG